MIHVQTSHLVFGSQKGSPMFSKILLCWTRHTLINLLDTYNYTTQFVLTIINMTILLGTGGVIRVSEYKFRL